MTEIVQGTAVQLEFVPEYEVGPVVAAVVQGIARCIRTLGDFIRIRE